SRKTSSPKCTLRGTETMSSFLMRSADRSQVESTTIRVISLQREDVRVVALLPALALHSEPGEQDPQLVHHRAGLVLAYPLPDVHGQQLVALRLQAPDRPLDHLQRLPPGLGDLAVDQGDHVARL